MLFLRLPRLQGGGSRAIALLLALLLAAPMAHPSGSEELPTAGPKRSFGPLEKSLLFPGWGQFAEKRYFEGAAFLGAEIFCLAEALANNRRGNESYATYQAASSMDEAVGARALVEKYDTRRNQFLLAAAVVWAANLLDIFLIVKSKKKDVKALSLRIGLGTQQDIGISAGLRF